MNHYNKLRSEACKFQPQYLLYSPQITEIATSCNRIVSDLGIEPKTWSGDYSLKRNANVTNYLDLHFEVNRLSTVSNAILVGWKTR